jgi:hypothetical protein
MNKTDHMKQIILLLFTLFIWGSSNANNSSLNTAGGGGSVYLINPTVTATLMNVTGLPAIKIEWDNSYRHGGQAFFWGVAWKFWLVRYGSNNAIDTVYYSRGTLDSAFIDTAIAFGSTYHYVLTRHEFFYSNDLFYDISDTVVVQTVDVPELEIQEESHKIYPNPCDASYVFLDYDTKQSQNEHLVIYNATGTLVSRQKLIESSTHCINISNLKSGTYFYQIRSALKESESVSGKLVVQ